jgi:hypothetical protein
LPNRIRKNLLGQAPVEFELDIDEAYSLIMNLYDAIDIAEKGGRGDILSVNCTLVALEGCCAGDNDDVYMTVMPERVKPDLKLVEE